MTDMIRHEPTSIVRNLSDAERLGGILAQSGFFADSRQAAQAVTKILAGAELGIGPVAAMTGIHIVQNRVTLSANLIAAVIKRSGRYNYRVEWQEDACLITFFEQGQTVGVSKFGKADAQVAKLNGDNWQKYPRNMWFARAMSNGAKWYTPDIFAGPVYTPDELGAEVDGETGDVITVPQAAQEPPHAPIQAKPPVQRVLTKTEPDGLNREAAIKKIEKMWRKEASYPGANLDQQKREQEWPLELPAEVSDDDIISLGQAISARLQEAAVSAENVEPEPAAVSA